MLKFKFLIALASLVLFTQCVPNKSQSNFTKKDKENIRISIQKNIEKGLEATRNKNIDDYMSCLPEDLKIYDESGEIVTRSTQRKNVIRDWAIIDTTFNISTDIDSIHFLKSDSIVVFTSQSWLRLMFQRNMIKTDTVLTTQKHKEIWKKTNEGWFGFDIIELGGEIFINGEKYNPNSSL